MSKILPKDSPILRKVALPVAKKDFGTKKLSATLTKMSKALHKEDDGVAIAAPQIGVSQRIFIVNGETLERLKKGDISKEAHPDIIFINPEFLKLSKKKRILDEGCLSVRWLYGKVERSEKATVKAFDQSGKAFTVGASGLLAQIFQHETDHLNGVLFIDKAKELEEIEPELKVRAKRRKK